MSLKDNELSAAFYLVYNYETIRLMTGSRLLAALASVILFFNKDAVWDRYVDYYREKEHNHWLIYNGSALLGILSAHTITYYDRKLLKLSLALAPEWRRRGLVRDFAPQVIQYLQTRFEECDLCFDMEETHPCMLYIERYFSCECYYHPIQIIVGPVTLRRNHVLRIIDPV